MMKITIRLVLGAVVLVLGGVSCACADQLEAKTNSVTVMTFNTWTGAPRNGFTVEQTANVIRKSGADVVGGQEIDGRGPKLAELLGWRFVSHGPRSGILTGLEIVKNHGAIRMGQPGGGGITVRLDSGKNLRFFNVHLNPRPYQPYQLVRLPRWGKYIHTEKQAIQFANKARAHQVKAFLKAINRLPDKETPCVITGDFNEPSHLDWTETTAKIKRHPIKVAYPASSTLARAGFTDAWRKFYPDEIKHPGNTWSPRTKPDDPKDHHDRIDFIYFKGAGVKVTDVRVVGENKEYADIVVSPYPSDHRGVVATLELSE